MVWFIQATDITIAEVGLGWLVTKIAFTSLNNEMKDLLYYFLFLRFPKFFKLSSFLQWFDWIKQLRVLKKSFFSYHALLVELQTHINPYKHNELMEAAVLLNNINEMRRLLFIAFSRSMVLQMRAFIFFSSVLFAFLQLISLTTFFLVSWRRSWMMRTVLKQICCKKWKRMPSTRRWAL